MPPQEELLKRVPQGHPRLFLRPENLGELRRLASTSLAPQYRDLLKQCEHILRNPPDTNEPPTYPEGTVVVRFDGTGVALVSASPAPGYAVDIEDAGPPRVELEFEGDGDDVRFRARFEAGELVVSLERDD
jgi:hypothetical protein